MSRGKDFCRLIYVYFNNTWAIPEPIKPPPIIVTFLMAWRVAAVENALFAIPVEKAIVNSFNCFINVRTAKLDS